MLRYKGCSTNAVADNAGSFIFIPSNGFTVVKRWVKDWPPLSATVAPRIVEHCHYILKSYCYHQLILWVERKVYVKAKVRLDTVAELSVKIGRAVAVAARHDIVA